MMRRWGGSGGGVKRDTISDLCSKRTRRDGLAIREANTWAPGFCGAGRRQTIEGQATTFHVLRRKSRSRHEAGPIHQSEGSI